MNKLRLGFKSAVGRNRGKISSYHRERGRKNLFYSIDFGRVLYNVVGKIKVIHYDFYRTSYIVGVLFTNGIFSYMLAGFGMKIGDFIYNSVQGNIVNRFLTKKIWISCALRYVKVGDFVYNLEYYPGNGGKIARSAGTFVKIVKKYKDIALIKLYSGEFRLFSLECMGTIGKVSNIKHHEKILRKAGVNRLLGWRPVVRGWAMNPVDHPHGGRTNGGIAPRTPWGKLTRGIKTVKIQNPQIIKRYKK